MPSADHVEEDFARGSLRAHWPAPGVLVCACRGFLDAEGAAHILSLRASTLKHQDSLAEFHDWSRMTGYASDARALLTRESLKDRPVLRGIHILVHSKLVHMGVTVASIPLGNLLVSYQSRLNFEVALRTAMAQA